MLAEPVILLVSLAYLGVLFAIAHYADRGISAQTTPQMLIRFRPDVIALNPRAVVILAGTLSLESEPGQGTLF